MPVTPPPAGRVLVAFDSNTLDTTPTWTRLDDLPNLVTSYTIDRGRQFELDRTDAARATVEIADKDGILDPTNPTGPYYGKLQPLKQAMIGRLNPVDGVWYTRFRGFIEEYDYSFDPSQRVNRLTLQLCDIYEIVSAVEFVPPNPALGIVMGHTPTVEDYEDYGDVVFYYQQPVGRRVKNILADAFRESAGLDWLGDVDPPNPPILDAFTVVFSGNVEVGGTFYSPGESLMTAIQEMADAEFPGVSNVYTDSRGRLVFHGRLAKFDPVGVWSGISADPDARDEIWDYHLFRAGDLEAAEADPPMARIRRFGFNRGLSKIINQAYALPHKVYPASPLGSGTDPTADEAKAQLMIDESSIGLYGIRSWTVQSLQTRNGYTDSGATRVGSLDETLKFAAYYINNYATPRDRVSEIGFRSIRPGAPGAQETWRLLSTADISDQITVTIASPGGGGFDHEHYFVEGVHETVSPLNPDYDNVELTLDLSPTAYYAYDPWAPP